MKQLNLYIIEKLKINKETTTKLIDKIAELCCIGNDEKSAKNIIETWLTNYKISKVDILCWHETLDNFNLPHDESKYIIDDNDLYSYYIHMWHDYVVYDFKSSKDDKFSVSHMGKGDIEYLVIGHNECEDGFKSFILVNHDKLISHDEIPE